VICRAAAFSVGVAALDSQLGVGKGASPEAAAAATRLRDEIAIPPSAIAAAIGYAIEQPSGIDISEIVVRPTVQA
jgi:NADP-dependent 3-hydroxy acid dehydrogenase YdfG